MPSEPTPFEIAYKHAFNLYLRRGIAIDIEALERAYLLKATVENQDRHSTPYYIWRTTGDDKVRASHAENNGKIFSWNNPPATGHPGEANHCRCRAEPYHGPITDGIENLNPQIIAIIASLALTVPRLAAAWAAWGLRRLTQQAVGDAERQAQSLREKSAKNWVPLQTKPAGKWANQMKEGDWTPEQISETILYGKAEKVQNRVKPDNATTQYHWNGKFMVVDDATHEVMQISRPSMKPNKPLF